MKTEELTNPFRSVVSRCAVVGSRAVSAAGAVAGVGAPLTALTCTRKCDGELEIGNDRLNPQQYTAMPVKGIKTVAAARVCDFALDED